MLAACWRKTTYARSDLQRLPGLYTRFFESRGSDRMERRLDVRSAIQVDRMKIPVVKGARSLSTVPTTTLSPLGVWG